MNANTLHVEVLLKQDYEQIVALEALLIEPLTEYILKDVPQLNKSFKIDEQFVNGKSSALSHVQSLLLETDSYSTTHLLAQPERQLKFHYYRAHKREMESEMLDNGCGDAEAVPSLSHWLLPNAEFTNLWENLIYTEIENQQVNVKQKLLKFALSALSLSQHNVNQSIIACNRLLLLHGPPGNGKTSLCKALAQKIAIRTRATYRHTHLIEINSHSLFSKWFSESGKLVMRLFAKIREIIADPHSLVCVLIDEVESLAYARNNMSGQEPKDAMRVVNALLTQLDSIREQPNVLILATSNLADSIDLAFLDRADIKQYIGLPDDSARAEIFHSMLTELMRVGVLHETDIDHVLLLTLQQKSVGMSGRTLRKLPFMAYAMANFDSNGKITLADFGEALIKALEQHTYDQALMQRKQEI